jgi:hypothetical protein
VKFVSKCEINEEKLKELVITDIAINVYCDVMGTDRKGFFKKFNEDMDFRQKFIDGMTKAFENSKVSPKTAKICDCIFMTSEGICALGHTWKCRTDATICGDYEPNK